MPHAIEADRRIRRFATIQKHDQQILALARISIARSLQILRDSDAGTFLGQRRHDPPLSESLRGTRHDPGK
jgi:hypothetical protein